MIDTTAIHENQQTRAEEMGEHLRAATLWDVVHRPRIASAFPARIRAARRTLKQIEHDLASQDLGGGSSGSSDSTPLELRANWRFLRSALRDLSEQPLSVASLPRIVSAGQQDEPRAAAIALIYLRAVDWDFSAQALQGLIHSLQAHEPLTLDELWNLPAFLKFILLESLLDKSRTLLCSPGPELDSAISIRLKSLRSISHTDWQTLIEPLIVFDTVLRLDPAETYKVMDFDSRELYRERVAFIARHSDCSESQVAQATLDLAREGSEKQSHEDPSFDPRMQQRRIHVGYYLLDKGFPLLAARTGFHPPLIERVRSFIRADADEFYITGIQLISIFFIGALMLKPLAYASLFDCLISVILLALPAMQCAVDLVNHSATAIFDPAPLPKLDFGKGIPAEFATLVAVPTLLLDEDQVRGLIADLEIRYLANRDPNLHYVLLTDLPDSMSKPRAKDSHPLVELAIQLIDELNSKYASMSGGAFMLLHRHRIFSVRQGVWMGWERKRGKLLDLNKLLTGEFDAFPIKAGPLESLSGIRYVLTLDSDTQLPRGAAARLIGAMAHPLHQAVIHPQQRIVTEGYGILQPRIGVSVRSTSRSRMAALYSGQSGFDIYTRAISDAYQDLYGEGIFTGKGIYEVATLHAVLNHRFPRNALLSHDLIEGAYARAGLVSDIELIDDYPSHLSTYSRRKHRWVRGDWQIAQWMFSQVPDEFGRWVPNPISPVARWKIFDNLRRSLVELLTFLLFVAGWLGLPGGPLYWTLTTLALLLFPTFVQFSFGLGSAFLSRGKGSAGDALSVSLRTAFTALLNLVFLPQQALLCLDAMVRALVRRFVTGERLLEWETAAQAEFHSISRTSIDRYLGFAPFVAFAAAALIYLFNPRHQYALAVAAPILSIWVLAPLVAIWLNAAPREQRKRLDDRDEAFLLEHALRIWRYFCEFGGERHNYLIPDNVEEDGLFEASRVSPTNLGLLLNARQAACAFGFLTVPEFVTLTACSLSTIARLEKYSGHLYNWYDTQTLEALSDAPFISSVDSGNFVASLYTLRSGALALAREPLLPRQLFSGLGAHWKLMRSDRRLRILFGRQPLPDPEDSTAEWLAWLSGAHATFAASSSLPLAQHDDPWWLMEMQRRIDAIFALLQNYMPWLLPEYAPLREFPELVPELDSNSLTVEDAIRFAENLHNRIASGLLRFTAARPGMIELSERLRESLQAAIGNLSTLAAGLVEIAHSAERLAEETQFKFLADPGRQILSIGYDVRAQKLHEACYDMIASEARIATFMAIAGDEIPQQSWFKLGREHTRAFGRFLLLSWTGTIFEYLMPALWMRSYPDTLVSRTLAACVQVQRAFAQSLRIPWGISESGASRKDHAGHYHYQAFGIPQVALWVEATAGPVVSPYSTFLALNVDSVAAVRNLRRMAAAGWVGAYGFYEAADYSASSGKAELVREWMAHHQGMSLLAILNLLCDNAVQRWFHSNARVQATELLLHELPVSKAVLKARLKE